MAVARFADAPLRAMYYLYDRLLGRSREPGGRALAGPIHGELLGPEHLAERARALAQAQRSAVTTRRSRRAPLLERLHDTESVLDASHDRLIAAASRGTDVGPAGDWLLDNFHVVEAHIREVEDSLPHDYYRELPELTVGLLAGYPRVYELAIALVAHSEGRVDRENLDRFVDSYQTISGLSIGELWAIPAMLRLALIENVRRMTLRTSSRLDEVEEAGRWAAWLQNETVDDGVAMSGALRRFVANPPALTPTFVSRLIQLLRLSPAPYPPLMWLEPWIAEESFSVDEATAQASQHLALTRLMMANSITSLRVIEQRDWRRFVEQHSALEHALRDDPSGHYAGMTFATRDRYRHVVERIAKRTRTPEIAVAREAVELAGGRIAAGAGREGHVGFFLIDNGLPELERTFDYDPPIGEMLHRAILRHPNRVFFGAIILGTVLAVVALLALAGESARIAPLTVILLALIPANDLALNVVNQIVTVFLPPRILPRLNLQEEGVPAECRTVVVTPVLFDDIASVDEAIANIEVQFLANHEPHIQFAVLSDLADATVERSPGDAAIIAAAVDGITALNERYEAAHPDAFVLMHRDRRWNESEQKWMGWERKRGKLAQFNRFLRHSASDAFAVVVGDVDVMRESRYVITLDADTILPPGAAAELIGTIAHPLNQAVVNTAAARIAEGYGVLQPRVGISPRSGSRSRFAAIHSGRPGVDPYSTAASDVYQDLHAQGSFTGKGIYDVDAFEWATHGRFPENTLLSHDLIEGNYARAGLVTDIIVYDDYPTSYLTYGRRKHRWIRGDWQLTPWLAGSVPGPDGPERSRLSMLSRWKIVDNLRRSVVEIAQLVFLCAGWLVLPVSLVHWTVLALGAIAAPWIMPLLIAMVRPPRDRSWRAYYGSVGSDAVASARQVAVAVIFLAHQAWLSADAIVRATWRITISRRHLLEWQTASAAERAVRANAGIPWRPLLASSLVAVIIVLAVVAIRLVGADSRIVSGWDFGFGVATVAVAWLVAPLFVRYLAKAPSSSLAPLTPVARAEAERLAGLHWQFFEQFVTAETHWLAPDNFQSVPEPVIAMRTSPTNIGLQLMSTVSALDLGLIAPPDMARRLQRALDTLRVLPRFNGHFYNWYDLRDLTVLEPAYVSTVDSGNLAGHLIAVSQACLSVAEYHPGDLETGTRLRVIAREFLQFASDMDFRFLYDRRRKLFTIGYHPASRTMDASFYDLLASEARLASFVAIAKNDVPTEHWARLGRGFRRRGGDTTLVSWSGSMFEYLMPSLVMRSYPSTLLADTCRSSVRRQIDYAHSRGVPWGISEAAYNVRDRHATYQYRTFGVPDLALKRGLDRELVIAPYASALAAMIDPAEAIENLLRLESMGTTGPYGFCDSLDYTRPDEGGSYALVQTWMAHHIGMTIVALTNVIRNNIWQHRFHADPSVKAATLLLDESLPRRLSLQEFRAAPAASPRRDTGRAASVARDFDTPHTVQPHVGLLGQSPFTVMVTPAGGGYSRFENLAVTRWRPDGTRDHTGQFCYLRDLTTGRLWSAGHQPVCAEADWYRASLDTDRVTLMRGDGEIGTRIEIVVVPNDAAEVRRVTVSNHSDEVRELELTSYGEIVMAPHDADRAHPAFSNLFVETEWHPWCSAITATRRPRSPDQPLTWCVHVVDTGAAERVGTPACETSRARFVGRGRSTQNPAALDPGRSLSETVGAVLDPVFAIRVRVRLEPRESAAVSFTTLVTTTRDRALELADRYHATSSADRAFSLASTAASLELRELDLAPADVAVFQDLASYLHFPCSVIDTTAEDRADRGVSQDMLWSVGISGDWPIVMATIGSLSGLPTLQQLLAAHRYWRRRGMTIDLVIVDESAHEYMQSVSSQVMELALSFGGSSGSEGPGGIFVRRRDSAGAHAIGLLDAVARMRVPCDGRPLGQILRDGVPTVEDRKTHV